MRKDSHEAGRTGKDRDEQADLQRDRPRLGVDADDFCLDLRRLTGEEFSKLGVCLDVHGGSAECLRQYRDLRGSDIQPFTHMCTLSCGYARP